MGGSTATSIRQDTNLVEFSEMWSVSAIVNPLLSLWSE